MTAPGPETPARRPEPVLSRARAAAGLTTLTGLALTVLVLAHVLTPDDSATLGPALAAALPTVVGAVSTIAAAVQARRHVTPLSDPRNAAGEALVTLSSVGQYRPPGGQIPGVPDHAAPE